MKLNLGPADIIAYAYFQKKVEYLTEFNEKEVSFLKQRVKGFYAGNAKQGSNISILKYWNDDKFIIALRLKAEGDELILVKGLDMSYPKDALNAIDNHKKGGFSTMNNYDQFEMPKLHLNHRRDYTELSGKFLLNEGFEKYFIAQMLEKIKFDMDQKGARVENEAAMAVEAGMGDQPKVKRFILDKPFWVVMRREDSRYPYFVLGVKNTELMERIR